MYRRISVHLDAGKDCPHRLDTALDLAKRHDAELIGIYACHDLPPYYFDAPLMVHGLLSQLRDEQNKARNDAATAFHAAADKVGVATSWRASIGMPVQHTAAMARYSDLLVIGQDNSLDPLAVSKFGFAEQVLMAAGRPVVVVPSAPGADTVTHHVGTHVLYCWDGGRESARALADAAPLLRHAGRFTVLTIDSESLEFKRAGATGEDLAAYCARQGFPAIQWREGSAKEIGIGACILNAAVDHDADLIVMGGYGHSRLRDWVMGGATKALLESMTLPVLFSH